MWRGVGGDIDLYKKQAFMRMGYVSMKTPISYVMVPSVRGLGLLSVDKTEHISKRAKLLSLLIL